MEEAAVAKSPYWHPKHETMSREELTALQLAKLRKLVDWTIAKVPWQKERLASAGITSGDAFQTMDDLRRIPFLTRDEWMDQQLEHPPYGPFLAEDPSTAIRYHMTSGTTGRTPIRVLDGMKDWEWIAECWCYGFWGFGIRPSDTVFFAFSYGTFVGFWGAHYACEKMGCLVLPGGNMTTEGRVRQIFDMNATVVCSTPTYALRMAQEAQKLGFDLPNGPVQRLILSGEPAGSIPATKKLIEEQWGAKAGDTAGMTELGTIMMYECEHQPGGAHIIEDHYIEEVIDPDTDEPVAYGEQGERVVTSFGRGYIPLLRYRSRDYVIKQPGSNCGCGRSFDWYDGGIRGRVDDMKLVRGTNVYPRAIEALIREFPEVDEFQIRLYTADDIRDEIEVLVEVPSASGDAKSQMLERLAVELREAMEGLRIPVKEVEVGTLPRFELKAKRVKDDRTVIGGAGEKRENN